MLVASLALLGALGAAVLVGRAAAEQRRLEQALQDVRLGDLKARTSQAEAVRAADWLSPITDPLTAPFAEATRSVAGVLARVVPSSRRRRRVLDALPTAGTRELLGIGPQLDEALLERRQLITDLSEDPTMAIQMIEDAGR
ncbi:hypothetical protein J2S40_001826 [Nocardioides luteus]|uniref:Histidine kinase n=1 Tax=Nocardioides luteus TaxID=1844 RepID=A0ABQ5T136_9ACTN|nr:hypothetical protein [Nocardioides luteus]MDR7310768.1 hypothetical protein [Nocardioides luteus]GGR40739.1 hypothetical protein GCM10010197_02280 [Nocardioides luteus]GLJ69452.1 hypothetical protein GCM10017579_34880 [Nocardioides luteus]